MNIISTLGILLFSAVLEAGGDALVRNGLHSKTGAARTLFFFIGAIVLFGYGYTVNVPDWDFGRLLGVYVVFFFVVAQIISWLVFHQPPRAGVLIGGAFIITGGAVITFLN